MAYTGRKPSDAPLTSADIAAAVHTQAIKDAYQAKLNEGI